MKRRYYIGLSHSIHDPALAIVDEAGEILFAEATERPLQSKRAWQTPPDLLHYVPKVLAEHCEPDAEFVLCTTWSRKMWFFTALHYLAGPLRPASLYRRQRDGANTLRQRLAWLFDGLLSTSVGVGLNLKFHLSDKLGIHSVRTRRYNHHVTHAATAAYLSPFDEAACVVVDGLGELGSVSVFHWRDGRLKQIARSFAYASLGFYYYALTEWCGFDPIKGEEWKVMGLAPCGEVDPELTALMDTFVQVRDCNIVPAKTAAFNKAMATLYAQRRAPDSSPLEAANTAASGQAVFARGMTELLTNVQRKTGSTNLCLGGGCALNSAYNGHIVGGTPFEQLFVPMAPADDGNAIGAALLGWQDDHPGQRRPRAPQTPYLGSTLSADTARRMAEFGPARAVRHLPGTIHEETAALLAAGKLVGWARGRAEFGPRALGNRSILADPRSPEMKRAINAKVKFREAFRPFAPSILHEHGPEWFEDYQASPYMERTLRWKPHAWDRVPSVVHANHTGRLQSVTAEANPDYHALISAFHRLTGVPLLLNTSFNVMGKPIIHSVEDAASVFATSGLDAMVIGDTLFEK